MKLDLTPLLNRRIPAQNFDFYVDITAVPDACELPYEIELSEDVHVSGRITDNDGYMTLKALVSVPYKTVCDRCLSPIESACEFDFSRIVTLNSTGVDGVDEDELLLIREGGIDFDKEIIEELSLELPIYHLCHEDCEGLCSGCGKPLLGGCTCKKEKELDPRLETFKKLLENMEK